MLPEPSAVAAARVRVEKTAKAGILELLEQLDALLDRLPEYSCEDGRWYRSGLGCRLLGRIWLDLEDRWFPRT